MHFSGLIGKIPLYIDVTNDKDEDYIDFYMSDGSLITMYHQQDCCESVYIEDIVGDLDKLLLTPIVKADEKIESGEDNDYESFTFTFYTLASKNGYVDIRWHGESNGYYSESVDISVTQYDPASLPNYKELKTTHPEILI